MDRRLGRLASLGCLLIAVAAGPALSQDRAGSLRPQEFGVSQEATYSLGSTDFVAHQPDRPAAYNFGTYVQCLGGSGTCILLAPVHLPSGARITSVEAFYYDTATENPDFFLTRCGDVGDCSTFANATGSPSASGPASLELTVTDPSSAVLNNSGHSYNLSAQLKAYDGGAEEHRLMRVAIRYLRQVSPTPVSATFNDVPTDHPYFRHIEALFDSGITAGCDAAPPMFCPDRSITRGEMAVFLAKALGLHWP
jgi:hypothetical protein